MSGLFILLLILLSNLVSSVCLGPRVPPRGPVAGQDSSPTAESGDPVCSTRALGPTVSLCGHADNSWAVSVYETFLKFAFCSQVNEYVRPGGALDSSESFTLSWGLDLGGDYSSCQLCPSEHCLLQVASQAVPGCNGFTSVCPWWTHSPGRQSLWQGWALSNFPPSLDGFSPCSQAEVDLLVSWQLEFSGFHTTSLHNLSLPWMGSSLRIELFLIWLKTRGLGTGFGMLDVLQMFAEWISKHIQWGAIQGDSLQAVWIWATRTLEKIQA